MSQRQLPQRPGPSLACALLALAPGCQTQVGSSEPIVIGRSHVLESDALHDSRQINVWYPQGHEQRENALTTVYLIDGGLDQDFQHIAGLAQLGSLSWTFGPLMIVGIETKERIAELTGPPEDERFVDSFPGAGRSASFREFIADEVIPFVESTYGGGSRRAIVGESLAGLFVAETFLESPELFDDYVAVSPSLWWDGGRLVQEAPGRLRSGGGSPKRLYLTMADEGGTMRSNLDVWMTTLKRDAPTSLEWTFRDRSKTHTHATIFHAAALDAFRWLYASPPFDYGPSPWYLIEGASPPTSPDPAPSR